MWCVLRTEVVGGEEPSRAPPDARARGPRPRSGRLLLLAVGSIERLAALGHLTELVARFEARPVLRRELASARDEGLQPHAVDERERAAGIGRVAEAEDRTDVGLARIGDDALE